jgi:hypothetical protein
MDISALVPVADAAEREFVRLRAACPHPYPRIDRAANILVADLVCKGTGDVSSTDSDTILTPTRAQSPAIRSKPQKRKPFK